eukprot:m.315884 g.315884  ORF g.315884 m.315884 type:complete len:245 (-) comp20282_c0_seq5:1692-2426(-)
MNSQSLRDTTVTSGHCLLMVHARPVRLLCKVLLKCVPNRFASCLLATQLCYRAQRNQFAGMTQSAAMEINDGGVSFDFVCNESIYRVAFCADVAKDFCFITQSKTDMVYRVYVFSCKSKKVAQKIADATAVACQRVFRTLALLKTKVKSLAEANAEVIEARSKPMGVAPDDDEEGTPQHSLVELINYEGYADADEKFRTEMLELAGAAEVIIPYQEPAPTGPAAPSRRTVMRQADPNEYERTRF